MEAKDATIISCRILSLFLTIPVIKDKPELLAECYDRIRDDYFALDPTSEKFEGLLELVGPWLAHEEPPGAPPSITSDLEWTAWLVAGVVAMGIHAQQHGLSGVASLVKYLSGWPADKMEGRLRLECIRLQAAIEQPEGISPRSLIALVDLAWYEFNQELSGPRKTTDIDFPLVSRLWVKPTSEPITADVWDGNSGLATPLSDRASPRDGGGTPPTEPATPLRHGHTEYLERLDSENPFRLMSDLLNDLLTDFCESTVAHHGMEYVGIVYHFDLATDKARKFAAAAGIVCDNTYRLIEQANQVFQSAWGALLNASSARRPLTRTEQKAVESLRAECDRDEMGSLAAYTATTWEERTPSVIDPNVHDGPESPPVPSPKPTGVEVPPQAVLQPEGPTPKDNTEWSYIACGLLLRSKPASIAELHALLQVRGYPGNRTSVYQLPGVAAAAEGAGIYHPRKARRTNAARGSKSKDGTVEAYREDRRDTA